MRPAGVPEDPATGSAAGPLAVHLSRHGRIAFGEEIEIRQGAEIGRPSLLHARAEGSLYDLDLTKSAAFLIGNEGAGLSDALLGAAKVRARIPMPGSIESLNAASAGSICLFEAVRQRTSKRR